MYYADAGITKKFIKPEAISFWKRKLRPIKEYRFRRIVILS